MITIRDIIVLATKYGLQDCTFLHRKGGNAAVQVRNGEVWFKQSDPASEIRVTDLDAAEIKKIDKKNEYFSIDLYRELKDEAVQAKPKSNSRYFAPVTQDFLKEKIIAALEKLNQPAVINYGALYHIPELTATVKKDIKVSFDTENIVDKDEGDYGPIGFHTLDNGMALFGFAAGGDWEYPVYFIIYWDGTKLRGYVPSSGNRWNTDTNEAYGNDDEKDIANFKKLYPEVKLNLDSDTVADHVWSEVRANRDLIIEDIKNRILPKES